MFTKTCTLLLCIVFTVPLLAQTDTEKRDEKKSDFADLEEIIYFTPGISAVNIGKNEMEFNLFNAYTFNQDIFNFGSPPYRQIEGSQNSFSTNLQVLYGISSNRNFNVGVDLSYAFFDVLESDLSILKVGPRIRWRPFGAINESLDITIQNAVRFVIVDQNNLFKTQPEIANRLLITKYFLEQNFLVLFNTGIVFDNKSSFEGFDQKTPLTFPSSLILSFYPRTNLNFYAGIEHRRQLGTVPWSDSDERYLRRTATSGILGFQYLINNTYSLFLSSNIKIADQSGGGFNAIIFGGSMLLRQ